MIRKKDGLDLQIGAFSSLPMCKEKLLLVLLPSLIPTSAGPTGQSR